MPWIVYSGFLLTEVAAYPAFLWALLALQRATAAPRPRNDLLALAGIALAVLARTQLGVLLVVLPLAIVVHEIALETADGGSEIGSAPRERSCSSGIACSRASTLRWSSPPSDWPPSGGSRTRSERTR